MRIRFDKIEWFIRVYNGTRYLVLFDSIYNQIRYLISVKSGITYTISHNFAEMKVDSYNSLPLGKAMTFHNIIIVISSVWNKDKNNYYYDIFFKRTSYQLPKK